MVRIFCDMCGEEVENETRVDLWEKDIEDETMLANTCSMHLCANCLHKVKSFLSGGTPYDKNRDAVIELTAKGYSAKEISDITGYTIGTIYQIRHQEKGDE